MSTVKIAELKAQLSRHLRAVEGGAEIVVTDRERPIARIVPMGSEQLRLIPPGVPFAKVRARRWAPAGWAVTSTQLLAEERDER
jgi:prevent-host-death family protein